MIGSSLRGLNLARFPERLWFVKENVELLTLDGINRMAFGRLRGWRLDNVGSASVKSDDIAPVCIWAFSVFKDSNSSNETKLFGRMSARN